MHQAINKISRSIFVQFDLRVSDYGFATWIIKSLFLNPKFQASRHLLWLYSSVCVGPGRKPRRQIFSRRGSFLGGAVSSNLEEKAVHLPAADPMCSLSKTVEHASSTIIRPLFRAQ